MNHTLTKHQRLTIFRKHFWPIFCGYLNRNDFLDEEPIDKFLGKGGTLYYPIAKHVYPHCLSNEKIFDWEGTFALYSTRLMDGGLIKAEYGGRRWGDGGSICYCLALQERFLDATGAELERSKHLRISREVISFLREKRNRPLLESLLVLGMSNIVDALNDNVEFGFYGADGNDIAHPIGDGKMLVNMEFLQDTRNLLLFTQHALEVVCTLILVVPWAAELSRPAVEMPG